jgi:hypothetical protein
MTIKELSGCTVSGITVNGKDWMDLTAEERGQAVFGVLKKIAESYDTNEITFSSILGLLDPDKVEYDDDPCDQCGDTVAISTWNV